MNESCLASGGAAFRRYDNTTGSNLLLSIEAAMGTECWRVEHPTHSPAWPSLRFFRAYDRQIGQEC